MSKPGLFISDVKLNFRLRDFFLDFMACIVPGLVFLISATFIVGGAMIIFLLDDRISALVKPLLHQKYYEIIGGIAGSFSFNFWFILLVTFLSYFAGHLLYRQTPKVPDFASFLRIRRKVIKEDPPEDGNEKGDWVIERGRGIKSRDVQFPYSNLKRYLKKRGFDHLERYIDWSSDTGQRSKTMINRAKIRVSFMFPEHTMHMIRNEAHIRLAASMWYAARYLLLAAYVTLGSLTIYLIKHSWPLGRAEKYFFAVTLVAIIGGYLLREAASALMTLFKEEDQLEEKVRPRAVLIDRLWLFHNLFPFICNVILIFGLVFVLNLNDAAGKEVLQIYLGIQAFILIGALFAKFRIEETIHYQRVREIIYVLETAFLSQVLDSQTPPDPNKAEKVSHEVNLNVPKAFEMDIKAG